MNQKLDEIALKMGSDLTTYNFRHTHMTVSARCGESLDEMQSAVGYGYVSDVITEYLLQTNESRDESVIKETGVFDELLWRGTGLPMKTTAEQVLATHRISLK